MKLSSRKLSDDKYREWHAWFAWFPVILNRKRRRPRVVWLQKVGRRLCETGGWDSDTYWKYQDPNEI